MPTNRTNEGVFLQLTPDIQLVGQLSNLSAFEWQTNLHRVRGVTFETLVCQIPFSSTGRRVVVLFEGRSLFDCSQSNTRWWKLFCKVPPLANQIRSVPLNRAIKSLEALGFKLAYYKA